MTDTAATDEAAKDHAAAQLAAYYEWPIGKARAIVDAVVEAYQKEARRA